MSNAKDTFGWLVRVTGTKPERRFVVRAEDERWAVGFVQKHADMVGVNQLEAGRFDGSELDGLAVGEVREVQ